jgi:hypothetical protein
MKPRHALVPQRSGVGASTAVFVVVIVVIVGVMGLISLTSQSGRGTVSSSSSTSSSTSTEEQQPAFFSIASLSGLQLQVELNATAMQTGSALRAQIRLFNPLLQNLSIALTQSSNSSIATWGDYDFVCGGSVWNLAGYALFKGHYSSDNISSAGEPLMLAPPVGIPCGEPPEPNFFVFLHNSSNAMASYSPATNEPATLVHIATNATTEFCENLTTGAGSSYTRCPVGASLLGYWSNPPVGQIQEIDGSAATIGSSYFHYFSPGQFTLAVEDAWGQTIYAHFLVTSASGSPVEVVSVTGPIPPLNPGGPVVRITLRNVGAIPITSLSATLPINIQGPKLPYSFDFSVNSSNPLMPGQTTQETQTLIGGGFDSTLQYPLTINGAFINGTQFSYTAQIQVLPPG